MLVMTSCTYMKFLEIQKFLEKQTHRTPVRALDRWCLPNATKNMIFFNELYITNDLGPELVFTVLI
jgi:hypothetical protein